MVKLYPVTREGDNSSSLLRNHLIEKEMMMMEHLSGLNLAPKRLTQQHYLTHGMEDMKVAEGNHKVICAHKITNLASFCFGYYWTSRI